MKLKVLRTLTMLLVVSVSLYASVWAVRNRQTPQGQERKKLRDIAQERDVEITSEPESEVEYGSLPAVTHAAHAIVRGRITAAQSAFEDDSHTLTTYQIDVRRVIKELNLPVPLDSLASQPAPLTTPLQLVRPGGVVNVNGHRAAVKVHGHERLQTGPEYIFFLQWSPDFKDYTLTGGLSGVVLVENDLCQPLATAAHMRRYDSLPVETFLRDVL